MSDKILVVDPICKPGHASFNATCIRALVSQGFEVTFVGVRDFLPMDVRALCARVLCFPPDVTARKGKFLSRLVILARLGRLRSLVDVASWGAVLLTDFEETTLFVSRFFSGSTYCVCHGTVEHMGSQLKRACAHGIFKHATAIAFNAHIGEGLKAAGIGRVVVSPHGLPTPFVPPADLVQRKMDLAGGRRVVVIPSVGEADVAFLAKLAHSERFLRFLGEQNLLLVARGDAFSGSLPGVHVLRGFLTAEEYQRLFLVADLVFIPYSMTLRHRVSNVLFECFANRVPAVILKSQGLAQFRSHFCYDPFVETEADLIAFLERFFSARGDFGFKDLDQLAPQFGFLRG